MLDSAQQLIAILHRVAGGDRGAFDELYMATNAKLYGIIVRVVVNRSTADEILQEVYVKIWQRAGDFDSAKASPITWMATIARNRAIDEIRRSKPHDRTDLADAESVPAELIDPMAGRERSEALRALMACLQVLPEERRDILLLAYCNGLSREALSQRFNKPVPTIKTWLFRGLAQLKTCLAT